MDPATATALDTQRPLVFYCLETVLNGDSPPVTLRLLDGPGSIAFGGMTFLGEDPVYGPMGAPAAIVQGVAANAVTFSFDMFAPSDDAALDLLEAATEDCTVRVWGPGVLDRATGLPVASPDLIFSGYVNGAVLTIDLGKAGVSIEVIDGFGRMLDRGDGYSMNNAAHQSIRPGETGLIFMIDVELTVYWGEATPGSSTATVITKSGTVATLVAKTKKLF